MILLMHPKYFELVNRSSEELRQFFCEARIPENTRIIFEPSLPEEDDEGIPILAFSVSAGETHYWRGEPIHFPAGPPIPDECFNPTPFQYGKKQ